MDAVRGAAHRGVEAIERFYWFRGTEKRLNAAAAALHEIATVAPSTADLVTVVAAQVADPKARVGVLKQALQAIAEQAAVMAAPGASHLAGLALSLNVAAPQALSSIARNTGDVWAAKLDGQMDPRAALQFLHDGQPDALLRGPLEWGRQLVLERGANLLGLTGQLSEAGERHLVRHVLHGGELSELLGSWRDSDDAWTFANALKASRPPDPNSELADKLLPQLPPERRIQAVVLEHALQGGNVPLRLLQADLPDSAVRPILQCVTSPEILKLEMLAGVLKLSDAEVGQMACDILGDGITAGAAVCRLKEDAQLFDILKGEPYWALLKAVADAPAVHAEARAETLRQCLAEGATDPPKDLAEAAEIASRLMNSATEPADALAMVGPVTQALKAFATEPYQLERLDMLARFAAQEPYEWSTAWQGIDAGLRTLAEDEQSGGHPLAAWALHVIDGLNYWQDQIRFVHLVLDRLGTPAELLKELDGRIDGPTEKERIHVLRDGLEYIGSNAVSNTSVADTARHVLAMAQATREHTESYWRDIAAGQVAADIIVREARRHHNIEWQAMGEFLQDVSQHHAENTNERLGALYGAIESLTTSSGRPIQRIAQAAVAAIEQMGPEMDQAAICDLTMNAVQPLADKTQQAYIECYRTVVKCRLYGDDPRADVRRRLLEPLTEERAVMPGTLAAAARGVLVAAESEANQRMLMEPLLNGIAALGAACGDEVYVPQMLDILRGKVGRAQEYDTWLEALDSSLEEMERFQGEAYHDMVRALKSQAAAEAKQVERQEDEVHIGDLAVPIRDGP